MSKRAFRDRFLPAGVAFLAGVGATVLAAYFVSLEEDRRSRAADAHRAAEDQIALVQVDGQGRVIRAAENVIQGLLRAPMVSESDRSTDIRAAQKWLYDHGRTS